ncbi:hypothetical protein RSOLAG22IIIB_04002 [Rhizoctonia solani]|uniref:Uncharacterized protein n=1 Tax=Rhizoctonia solani TaxID=456999 RepID=A0A0K6FUA3_9AGAM|nr:hypothetical protein RSOLAG22IIIB_04002 [Rhizoctonia solani]
MTRLNIPLFVALAASILSAVPVDGRDTLPHQRMIRKRGPAVVDGPGPIGAVAAVIGLHVRQIALDPTGSASQPASSAPASTTAAASTTRDATTSTAAATTTTPATSSAAATTSASSSSSAAQATTSSGGLLNSLTAILGGSTTSTSSSSSSLATSSTPVTSSTPTPTSTSTTQAVAPSTTQQQQQQPAAETSPTLNIATPSPSATARSPSISVNVITSTLAAAEASASASAAAAKAKTQKITRNTIVSLVVIASCIGGAIAIWTVIRKWKLSPSEKFDDRTQPIDWAPPPANGLSEEAIEEKTKHRRAGSGASHGSFTSGGVGQSEQGHAAKYADSQHGHGYAPQSQDFPPPHDFTAGTAQPGGYGQYYGAQQYATGPGYADLQRGPSLSESNYSNGANVSRGMSYSRGHGAYDSQSGALPQMPNPYGGEYGYEEYNHPPAGQQPQAQAQAQAPAQAQAQGQAPYRAF